MVCALVKFIKVAKKFGTLLHNTCHGKTVVRSYFKKKKKKKKKKNKKKKKKKKKKNSYQQRCVREHTEDWNIPELQVNYCTELKYENFCFSWMKCGLHEIGT
jgi:hypothetical protein